MKQDEDILTALVMQMLWDGTLLWRQKAVRKGSPGPGPAAVQGAEVSHWATSPGNEGVIKGGGWGMSHLLRMERGGTGVSEALCQQSKHRSSLRETVTEYIRKYLQNHYLPRNAMGLINPLEPEGKKITKLYLLVANGSECNTIWWFNIY